MVYLAGIIAGLVLCLGYGWFSLALSGAGLLAFISYFSRGRLFSSFSLSLFLSALYSAGSVAFDFTSMGLWLVSLYLGKLLFLPLPRQGFPYLSIPLAFWTLLNFLTHKTFEFHFLLPALVACLPCVKIPELGGRLQRASTGILWAIFILIGTIPILVPHSEGGGVAFIENGKWAKTDEPFRLEGLDIASSYSYSEFLHLIGGHLASPETLTKKERIAWIITPTTPLSEQELAALEKWVLQGGHLVAVSDHTDLFGHARTMNSVLYRFGLQCTYSATITDKSRDPITYGDGTSYSILTGNTVLGPSIWPLATTLEFMEGAYYARPNFFGPLSPQQNTPFGRWLIMGCKAFGRGMVTLVTDSTVLSNFAVYQPGTSEFIERAQSRPLMATLMGWLPLGGIVSLLIALLAGWRRAIPVCLLGLFAFTEMAGPKLNWSEHDLIWSGERSLVLDNANPRGSFTTAFSISALSGSRPKWKDCPSSSDKGIWVAKTPPPNKNWKWLSPEKNKQAEYIQHDSGFNALLGALGTEPLLGWQSIKNTQRALAGSIWTDDHMGTWWFDRGLSPSRQARFQSFLDWINSKPLQPNPEAFNPNTSEYTDYVFKMEGGGNEIPLKCPKLPMGDTPILIGNGISAQMVKIDGRDALISVSPWMEYWQSPKIWTATEKKGEKEK